MVENDKRGFIPRAAMSFCANNSLLLLICHAWLNHVYPELKCPCRTPFLTTAN